MFCRMTDGSYHEVTAPESRRSAVGPYRPFAVAEQSGNKIPFLHAPQANAYALRGPRAWDAALDFGLARLKDIAFERAIEGELLPVFAHGKLMGFRRKHNTALLIFCLRHYGQDAAGKRTTINYFSTRASAGAAAGGPDGAGGGESGTGVAHGGAQLSAAQASTTTMRTVITGVGSGAGDAAARDDRLAAALDGFGGVTLDAEAEAAIASAIADCAARRTRWRTIRANASCGCR